MAEPSHLARLLTFVADECDGNWAAGFAIAPASLRLLGELVTSDGGAVPSRWWDRLTRPLSRWRETMANVGGDGFLITSPVMRLNRRHVTDLTGGLIPAPQKRGPIRVAHATTMPRDHLRDF